MLSNEKKKFVEENKIIYLYLLLNFIFFLLIILSGYNDYNFLIERAKNVFGFWLILFLCFFLPRRILKKSKSFRYIIINIRKYYPILFYYRIRLFNFLEYISFCFDFIIFYLERILKYLLIGNKIKWLSYFKENTENEEFIKDIIIEIFWFIYYLILYIFKMFYEIIKFFDNATIYKIIRSRVIGFIIITTGYIIIGINFFIIYIVVLFLIFFLYSFLNIYLEYLNNLSNNINNFNKNYILKKTLFEYGFNNKVNLFFFEIKNLRYDNFLMFKVLNLKKYYILFAIKRKYDIYFATKCALTVNYLSEVVIYKNNYILTLFISENFIKKNNLKIVEISLYNFTTKFLIKKNWYYKNDLMLLKMGDSFSNAINGYNIHFINKLDFQLDFVITLYIRLNKFDIFLYQDLFNYKMIESFFEFNEIVSFMKILENKILLEGGPFKFYQKYFIKNNISDKLENIFLNQKQNKISIEEAEIGLLIILCDFLKFLQFNVSDEELSEIFEKKYKNFIKK